MPDWMQKAVTPLLPELPGRETWSTVTLPNGAQIPRPKADQWLTNAIDAPARALYNWGLRPMSSPVGIGSMLAAPLLPLKYVGAAGAALGGKAAIEEGKAGHWLPSTESPGAILDAGLAGLGGLGMWQGSRTTPRVSGWAESPETVNAGRREFMKKAGPIAVGTAAGAPTAVKVAESIGKWGTKAAPVEEAAAAGGAKLVGMQVAITEPDLYAAGAGAQQGYGIIKTYKLPNGDYQMRVETTPPYVAGEPVAGHPYNISRQEALKYVPEEMLKKAEEGRWGIHEAGESFSTIEGNDHLYVVRQMDDPIVPSRWTYERIDHVHPKLGELTTFEPVGPGNAFEASFFDPRTGGRTKIVAMDGASDAVTREYLGNRVVDEGMLKDNLGHGYEEVVHSNKAYTAPDVRAVEDVIFINPDGSFNRIIPKTYHYGPTRGR